MNKTKTIRGWLQELPDGYRERALRNYDPNYHDGSSVNSLSYAISVAFDWEDAPEGYDFWSAVEYWATPTANLPPLPEEEK